MSLETHRQLEATRKKLHVLQQRYEAIQQKAGDDEHVRELSLQSIKRAINQLTEEIARFEVRQGTTAKRS